LTAPGGPLYSAATERITSTIMGRSMRRRRLARFLFGLGWLGALGGAIRVGATAYGVTPEALLASSYLGTWGLVFLLSRRSRTIDAARFAAVTGSILLAVAAFEVPSAMGPVNYRGLFKIPTPTWRRPASAPTPS
jgi:hypothetical protein